MDVIPQILKPMFFLKKTIFFFATTKKKVFDSEGIYT